MRITYLILSIVILLYVLIRRKSIDFLVVYVMSAFLYYFPAYYGTIWTRQNHYAISEETYIALTINLLVVFLFMLVKDTISLKRTTNTNMLGIVDKAESANADENIAVLFLAVVNFVIMSFYLWNYGVSNLLKTFDKVSILQSTNKAIEYSKYISMFVFCYAFSNQGKFIVLLRTLGVCFILYTFLLGHRSFLVIALIATIYNYLRKNTFHGVLQIIKLHKFQLVVLLAFVIFTFAIKHVQVVLFMGDFDLVFARLTSAEFYRLAFLRSEPNTIISNLNNTLVYNIKTDIGTYLGGLVVVLTPIIGSYVPLPQSYSKILEIEFNPRAAEGIGLGSTFIGEAISCGGYFFLIVVLLANLIIINVFESKLHKTKSAAFRTWLSLSLCYLTFYINRNSMAFTWLSIRALLYIVLLVKFVLVLYRSTKQAIC